MNNNEDNLPIAVDLDGTLIFDEITAISLRKFCLRYPWKIVLLPFWLLKGMAYLKDRMGGLVDIDPRTLSYNNLVMDYIKSHAQHRMVLATGADQRYADAVAEYLGCFELVIASDGVVNRVSQNKADCLNLLFGEKKYIYVGNSSQDIAVWRQAAHAVVVNAPESVLRQLHAMQLPYELLK